MILMILNLFQRTGTMRKTKGVIQLYSNNQMKYNINPFNDVII